MELRPLSSYVRELRPALPTEVFAPARSRLLWLPVHLAIITVATLAIALGWLPWPVVPLVSLLIGVSFAGLTFLGHETLHGAVVRGQRLKRVIGWFGFLPFVVSPRLWIGWHNSHHHANANRVGADPDMYPTLLEYEASRVTRAITNRFALGGGRWTGVLSCLFGYTGQSSHMLLTAKRRGLLSPRDAKLAFVETGLGILVWSTVLFLVGPLSFLFVFLLPLMVANAMVMTYILTNHGLSPLTDVNDALVNSLSVTVPRWYEWLTLGFGHHTEHHLFPAMSSRHAPAVRAEILTRWPERYQSMSLRDAVSKLHRTARVYGDQSTLVDPPTGGAWTTLLPRPGAAT